MLRVIYLGSPYFLTIPCRWKEEIEIYKLTLFNVKKTNICFQFFFCIKNLIYNKFCIKLLHFAIVCVCVYTVHLSIFFLHMYIQQCLIFTNKYFMPKKLVTKII